MQPLPRPEDTPVAGGSARGQDAVQRVRGPVQVGPARTRVPASREPDIRVGEALELAPEGSGDEATEGNSEAT